MLPKRIANQVQQRRTTISLGAMHELSLQENVHRKIRCRENLSAFSGHALRRQPLTSLKKTFVFILFRCTTSAGNISHKHVMLNICECETRDAFVLSVKTMMYLFASELFRLVLKGLHWHGPNCPRHLCYSVSLYVTGTLQGRSVTLKCCYIFHPFCFFCFFTDNLSRHLPLKDTYHPRLILLLCRNE